MNRNLEALAIEIRRTGEQLRNREDEESLALAMFLECGMFENVNEAIAKLMKDKVSLPAALIALTQVMAVLLVQVNACATATPESEVAGRKLLMILMGQYMKDLEGVLGNDADTPPIGSYFRQKDS